MADYWVTDTELTSIADAIRAKGGTSASLTFPTGFADAIDAIPSGGGGSHTVTVTLENPISASSFSYCKIYEWDGNDSTLGAQIGEITSPTGSTTITTSATGIAVLLSGDYATPPTAVGTEVWCTGLIGLAYSTEGEPARMYFAIGGDSETDISRIDWSD